MREPPKPGQDQVARDAQVHAGGSGVGEGGGGEGSKGVGGVRRTARKEEPDRSKGLSRGADDYNPKPFSPQELVLRVGAVLRRLAAPAVAAGRLVAAGPIVLDRSAHRVTVDGTEVDLTATEFKLLGTLIEREARVQSRPHLLETVCQAQPA